MGRRPGDQSLCHSRRAALAMASMLVGAVGVIVAPTRVGGSAPAPPGSAAQPSTSVVSEIVCPDATTTTIAATTSTTVVPSVCDVLAQLPPERVGEGWDSVWDGIVSGTVQPVGCTPVAQSGSIVLLAFVDGEVVGLGRTDTGAYRCENGVDVPPAWHTYGISGTLTDRFTLTFEDGVTLTSGPIVDDRAVVRQDTGFGVVTIELSCRDCATDAPESTISGDTLG